MVSIGAPRNSDGGRRLRGDRCGSLTHSLRCSVRSRASQLTLARMDIDLAALPDDVETLHRMVRSLAVERTALTAAQGEIERLRLIVQKLQRNQFGRRAERLDNDQLQFGFEDIEVDLARVEAKLPPSEERPSISALQDDHLRLPPHLEREDRRINIEQETCTCCGGPLHFIGESVSEMLDHVPARLRVIRIRRPRFGCRACGTIHQAPAAERPIAKGLATPALLAHVLVSKYSDHLPLYRQSQIFARQGVELNRSTLANWVGGAVWWLEPLQARLDEYATLYPPDQRIQQEAGELAGGGFSAFRALQSCASAQDHARHASDGGERDGSAMVD